MSDATSEALNLREQIVRIDRAITETHKFQAEAAKLHRDRFFAPVLTAAAVSGAVATILPTVLRAWGVHL